MTWWSGVAFPRYIDIDIATAELASSSATVTAASSCTSPPPDLEKTLATLIFHRSVLGYLVLSRPDLEPVSIRHAGVMFEGEQGRKYASAVQRIVETCQSRLQEVGGGESVSRIVTVKVAVTEEIDVVSVLS